MAYACRLLRKAVRRGVVVTILVPGKIDHKITYRASRRYYGEMLLGGITNAVNFPNVEMARESAYRIGIANANVPNMVGGISHEMAEAGLNIATMTNKSRRDLAYTLVDVDSDVPPEVIKAIGAIDGVLMVRYLPLAHPPG